MTTFDDIGVEDAILKALLEEQRDADLNAEKCTFAGTKRYWEGKSHGIHRAIELVVRLRLEKVVKPGHTPRVCEKCGTQGQMYHADMDWCPTCHHSWYV